MTPKEITSGVDLVSPVMMTIEGQDVEVPHLPGPPLIYITLLTSMFMHGSIGHLFGNMLYLWIFGDNVEHRFGHIPFLIFYLVSGLFASFAQIVIAPDSVIPNLGASGAIFGILGAYMVLFPRNKVNAILLYFVVSLPALYVIGLWTVLQVFSVFGSFFGPPQAGGVAYIGSCWRIDCRHRGGARSSIQYFNRSLTRCSIASIKKTQRPNGSGRSSVAATTTVSSFTV